MNVIIDSFEAIFIGFAMLSTNNYTISDGNSN